jgi:YbgC/YbaW family acyl-CoA thioester hydrolase
MFEFKFSVRGYELDSYGHVNNAVYMNYFEQARWEILRQLGLFEYFSIHGHLLVVTEARIRYSREIRLFDNITIRTLITKESPYLVFNHKMYVSEKNVRVCSAIVKTVLTNKEKVLQDIPEAFLKKPEAQ